MELKTKPEAHYAGFNIIISLGLPLWSIYRRGSADDAQTCKSLTPRTAKIDNCPRHMNSFSNVHI
ncbi:hypothetical protein APHWI1_1050 [Anaplasma phagocytophilum str. ApWI1]|uniref:Uncharacterized protein n=3 Tax=Anaplasma phagocytophilum TaxID=948 RepID=Q2GLR1_ANAPZ|nr:hypothetical protein APH_0057 [Anaplasma phagocytophilum str. HZ]KJV68532.1 hypothetical protein EPHNCH_0259 [Anaplasma phagocytophilum str. NCH-1]KJV82721.1 hypothetical protein APHHGE2_0272 [Anaplasma phagocytophilum str. HGE2]KJV84817.1 hypothetical protein APHWI1_1050 [Anaplasma phagocytophilum str. ApWI1]